MVYDLCYCVVMFVKFKYNQEDIDTNYGLEEIKLYV